MGDSTQREKEDGEAPPGKRPKFTPWPSSLKCENLAIKTSLKHDQLKVTWIIDEFGIIPKEEDILKLYSTDFVMGVKNNIPCDWRVGLGLTQAPALKPDVQEEWLCLYYEITAAPPKACMVFYHISAQVDNPHGEGEYSGTTAKLEPWNNLGDIFSLKLVPQPKQWPKNKPLQVDIDLTIIVKHVSELF